MYRIKMVKVPGKNFSIGTHMLCDWVDRVESFIEDMTWNEEE